MIKLICDRCGKDCGLVARDILINDIENPVPTSCADKGQPMLSVSHKSKRLLLCQDCYRITGLPNLYEDGLIFRDNEDKNIF